MINRQKVLVVDDSTFMRKIISDIINNDPYLQVVDTAKSGKECLDILEKLRPDVITLDIEMPGISGLEVLEQIVKNKNIPVVMISGHNSSGTDNKIKALEIGAIDFVTKPSGTLSLDLSILKDEIVNKVRKAADIGIRIKSQSTSLPTSSSNNFPSAKNLVNSNKINLENMKKKDSRLKKVVAIGTSTGGPKALQELIPRLPKDIPAGILIVQHMPKGFTKSLADRLNALSNIYVKEAKDGDEVLAGVAYLAPGDYHMQIINSYDGKYYIKLNQDPPRSGHRPSVDTMFESVSKLGLKTVGVIMTGMGQDGVEGMLKMKEAGSYNIAEDQSTCVVFGMPKVAIERKCVDKILPLPNIADEVIKNLL